MNARFRGLLASLPVWIFSLHSAVAQEQNPVPSGPNPGRGINAHDPCTIHKHNGTYWTFTTGRGVSSLHSTDLVTWRRGPAVFPEIPEWVTEITPQQRGHFWAPDLIFHNGRYLLYYSISTFGQRTSAIALASASTLDPADPEYGWKEEGIVIRTTNADNFNAIDPSVLRSEEGRLWMAFGSFWSGIKLIELHPQTGLRIAADSPMHSLAHKSEIEAATLHFRDGFYYLFVNWGHCCRGLESTYNIRVGRGREITGPYLDREGVDLMRGGGTLVLETEGRFIGPGHAGIFKEDDRYLLSYHFYDRDDNGRPKLAIRPLEWDAEGWPRIAGEVITPPAGGEAAQEGR
jgi:arabinan endo-1,5-alpha-L-arabinosidase